MKNNQLKSTVMLMTAVMGLSVAVPTFTSVGSDVTAQAMTYKVLTDKESKEYAQKQWDSMSASAKKEEYHDLKVAQDPAVTDKNAPAYKYGQALKKAYAYKVSKLTAKKTKSNQYVKVSGTIKVNNKTNAKKHKATWARITTYKGYKYVRLSKKGTFTKTIKAPKAKSTWAKAGYYAKKVKKGKTVKKNGKIVYTFHLLSDSKKAKVQAYK
ncbi:hypothetical protein [Levilactobacillus sp. HBUAS70063]|uniref:hypothetical protein n=1 Tax=Levilactobacillus sp. HBUAS70063 TaxID=3109359 RepID=UPI0031331385